MWDHNDVLVVLHMQADYSMCVSDLMASLHKEGVIILSGLATVQPEDNQQQHQVWHPTSVLGKLDLAQGARSELCVLL